MKLLMKLFSIFCWHKYKFKSNIHPEISDVNGIGSVEQCIRCGKLKLNKKPKQIDKWKV